jgi:hypothetical protein
MEILQDRRAGPRLVEETRIKVMLIPEDSSSWYGIITCFYHTRDVSSRGLSFHSYDEIPINSFMRIDVSVRAHVSEVIPLTGVVRWTKVLEDLGQFRVGVEILDYPVGVISQWESYVGALRKLNL